MKKTKIIYINTMHHYSRELEEMVDDDWFYLYGMGHCMVWELNKVAPDVLAENWRADSTVKKSLEKKVQGVNCRVFPAKKLSRFGDFSNSLIRALKNEAKQFNIIVHFMGMHSMFYNWIAWKLRKYPIAATHLGGGNPLWKYHTNKKIANRLFHLLEKFIFLPRYDLAVCTTQTELDYLKSLMKKGKALLNPIFGIDFNHFYPKNKIEAREKLNIPLEKKLILQVGRAMNIRGFDWIMQIIKHFQNKKDVSFYFVDTQPNDEYYEAIKQSGVAFTGRVFNYDLAWYYSAADVSIYFPHDDESLNFAGTSYVPLECLACGTPVVATTLRHFPDTEVSKIAYIPNNFEEAVKGIETILANPLKAEDCVSLVSKHYAWDKVMTQHINEYNLLLQKYYPDTNNIVVKEDN